MLCDFVVDIYTSQIWYRICHK